MVEPRRTVLHKMHPVLRGIAGWFLVGVFDTFTEPMFTDVHDAIVWIIELVARVLLGA